MVCKSVEDVTIFLSRYNLKYNKIASPMLTNIGLLKAIAKEKDLHLYQQE